MIAPFPERARMLPLPFAATRRTPFGKTIALEVRPQVGVIPRRLLVPDSVSPFYVVTRFREHREPVDAGIFSPHAFAFQLTPAPVQPREPIMLEVRARKVRGWPHRDRRGRFCRRRTAPRFHAVLICEVPS